ncbi:fructose-bisphosphate aldolase-lysine N-methyltransferase, chloroplastic [Impatiens glandulifera]|uniref:fructose-bisphosphate aldolase-lysine N-methyltransferase, chloroplastic n=1 Tax=Impatiens glandulifera TaxID=253017 RepID=UPI001FB0C33E|nr:fructose-bisphosphate aldolase-lysine N-methyltransferase, chloroplastic [Impatiens glandulifera]
MITVFRFSPPSSSFTTTTSITSSSSLKLKVVPKHPSFLRSRKSRRITTSRVSAEVAAPVTLDAFWKWVSDEGIISSKCPLQPTVVAEGLGLVAKRDISRNDVVLEVPKKFWINPDTVAASDIGRVCGGLKPWISVALFLIREKKLKDKSKWRYYLDILPQTTDSTLFWSEEELYQIRGSQLLSTTRNVKQYVQTEFEKLQEEVIIPNNQLFPFQIQPEDFLWAFGILRSRAFSRLRGQNLVLIPIADLINHSPDITTEEYAWEIKGGGIFSKELFFSLRTPVFVKAGQQVLIQYDLDKSNAELALDYGFTENNPSRNAYTLTLQISESDQFVGDKLDIAELNKLGETASFDIVLGSPLPPMLLPYLRLVALGGTDVFLLESIFRNSIWGHLELPVSRSNEELICKVVREACTSALSGYLTTIEEDENLLEEGGLDPRVKTAVEVRAGEKKILKQIDEIFEKRETELDELEYYQERRLKDLGLVGEQGEIIFWE